MRAKYTVPHIERCSLVLCVDNAVVVTAVNARDGEHRAKVMQRARNDDIGRHVESLAFLDNFHMTLYASDPSAKTPESGAINIYRARFVSDSAE